MLKPFYFSIETPALLFSLQTIMLSYKKGSKRLTKLAFTQNTVFVGFKLMNSKISGNEGKLLLWIKIFDCISFENDSHQLIFKRPAQNLRLGQDLNYLTHPIIVTGPNK